MTGKIFYLSNGNYEWIIKDFFSVTKKKKMLTSPSFCFHTCFCTLILNISNDEVTLGLNSEGEERFHVKLGLSSVKEFRSGITEDGIFTVEKGVSYLELKAYKRAKILLNGRLTVYCKLSTVPDAQENLLLKELEPSFKKLIEDLESLLNSDDDSDVIFKVQGKEFPAHKNILRVRSPVFKSMFSHNMLENESGVVNLVDCNPDTFPDFLKYLYTGKTEHLSLKNVFDLYTVSDKYCIDELKVECSLFIRRNLSVETFCDAIILGLRHDEKELIEAANAFFSRCAAEIVKSPKWQNFLREKCYEVSEKELFIKFISPK